MPPKALKFNNDNIQECIDKFNEYKSLIDNSADKFGSYAYDANGIHFDSGDFMTIAYLFNITGDTLEERQADMDRQYKDMRDAFLSGNPKAKEPYLDLMYGTYINSYKSYDEGIDTPEEFVKACGCALNTQAIAVKRNENPDFYYSYFDTIEKQNRIIASTFANDSMGTCINKLREDHPDFKIRPIMELDMLGMYTSQAFGDGCVDAIKEKSNTITFKVPAEATEEEMEQDINSKPFSTTCAIQDTIVTYGAMENIVEKASGTSSRDYRAYSYTFLDGKNLYDLAKAELRKTPEFSNPETPIPDTLLNNQSHIMFCDAMLKGDKVISVAVPHIINDKVEMSLMTLKPDVSEVRALNVSRANPLRRLFDWGPFKIKPIQSKVDELYKNAKNHDTQILAKATEQFNKNMAELRNDNSIPRVTKAVPQPESLNAQQARNILKEDNMLSLIDAERPGLQQLQNDSSLENSEILSPKIDEEDLIIVPTISAEK